MTQTDLDAIRSRCEKETPDAAAPVYRDMKALLDEVEQLQNKVKLQKASCSLVKTVEAGKILDENAILRKALEIAAEESEEAIYKGTDENEIIKRWIKKAEELK